jgi:ankyrin repeat protein
MLDLLHAIAARDGDEAARLLQASPALATSSVATGATRQEATPYYLDAIGHYVYAGDTALHIAAAAYDASVVHTLLAMGAGVDARNRAVRTRCSGAVRALLDGGADPSLPNKSGSTPLKLATRPTGRGGSGSPDAQAQQAEIVAILEQHGGTP